MAEQWSSKSHVWVRFLLPLLRNFNFNKNYIFNYKKKKIKIINLIKIKNKSNFSVVTKIKAFRKYFYLWKKKTNTTLFYSNLTFNTYIFKNFFSRFYLDNFMYNHTTKYSLKINFFLFFFNFFKNFFLNYLNLSNSLNLTYFYFINNTFLKNDILSNLSSLNLKYSSKNFFYFNSNRLILNKKISKIFQKNNFIKIYNLKIIKSKIKILRTLKIISKSNKIRLFKFLNFFSKFFFKNIFFNDKIFNIFFLNKYDWLNNYMTRLTKSSFRFNFNDYFISKNLISKKNNFLNFLNFNDINENFYQNSYYFIFKTKKKNPQSFHTTYNYLNFQLNKLKKKSKIVQKFNSKSILNFNFFSNFNIFNKFELIILFFFKSFFLKYLFFNSNIFNKNNILKNKISNFLTFFKDFFFYSKRNFFFLNNLIPNTNFNYIIKKKMLKIFNYSKFPTITILWQYSSFVRFIEFCSGKKVFLNFFNFLVNKLNFSEKAQCLLWAQKVKYFRKVLGPRLFLNESLQIIYLSLKLKDPYILSNWMVSTMYKISFWKYKMFLRYIKYVLRYFFWVIYKELKIKGVKFQLKGKVSVAGNARTRTVFHTIGFTSHSTFNNKILYNLSLVRSFTGVMGLKLWIVF